MIYRWSATAAAAWAVFASAALVPESHATSLSATAKALSFSSIMESAQSCEIDVPRGDCRSCLRVPHCGYCADDDSCHTGTQKGPFKDLDCKSWHFSKCDKVEECETITSCGECLSKPRCGWCATEDPSKIACRPAAVGADNSFRRNPKCQYSEGAKNLWFHTFDTSKIGEMCLDRLPRTDAVEKAKATKYWKMVSADKGKYEEGAKKALLAKAKGAARLAAQKRRAATAEGENNDLAAKIARVEKELAGATTMARNLMFAYNAQVEANRALGGKVKAAEAKVAPLVKANSALAEKLKALALIEVGSSPKEAAQKDLDAGKAALENLEATLEKLRVALAKGESKAKLLKTEQTSAQERVDRLTGELRLAKAKKVVADAEARAADAARKAEELSAIQRTAERTKVQRQISAEVIANQQKREDALRRIALEKDALFDERTKAEQAKLMNLAKVQLEQLRQKVATEENIAAQLKNATAVVAEETQALEAAKAAYESLKAEVQNKTKAAQTLLGERDNAMKEAVGKASTSSDPVRANANVREATELLTEQKEILEEIKATGEANVTVAMEAVNRTEAAVAEASGNLAATKKLAEKQRVDFQQGSKQAIALGRAGDNATNANFARMEETLHGLLSEAAVANGKAEAASKLLNERSSELNSAIEEDLRKDEEKAKVDLAQGAKLEESDNVTLVEQRAEDMAAKLSEDASKLENISSTEGGMIRSSETTKTAGNVSSHADENKKLAQTVKAANRAVHSIDKAINDTKADIGEVRSEKTEAENATASDDQVSTVNTLKDAEAKLEQELPAMESKKQEREEFLSGVKKEGNVAIEATDAEKARKSNSSTPVVPTEEKSEQEARNELAAALMFRL